MIGGSLSYAAHDVCVRDERNIVQGWVARDILNHTHTDRAPCLPLAA